MLQVTGYTIEEEDNYFNLINKVQESVDMGWEPVGGVAIHDELDSEGNRIARFYQALIVRKEKSST